jgi:hypothetical protein
VAAVLAAITSPSAVLAQESNCDCSQFVGDCTGRVGIDINVDTSIATVTTSVPECAAVTWYWGDSPEYTVVNGGVAKDPLTITDRTIAPRTANSISCRICVVRHPGAGVNAGEIEETPVPSDSFGGIWVIDQSNRYLTWSLTDNEGALSGDGRASYDVPTTDYKEGVQHIELSETLAGSRTGRSGTVTANWTINATPGGNFYGTTVWALEMTGANTMQVSAGGRDFSAMRK